MAYIGKEPANVGQRSIEDIFTATANQTVFTLTADVDYESDIIVTINGVTQSNAAFGLDGTGNRTLTFSSGMTVDDVVRVVHHGYKPMTVSVDDLSITTQKIADNAIDSDHYIDGSIDKVHIADGAIDGTKIAYDVSVGNTANTNSSQGDNPITTYFYEIATCANAGDAVTLPTATAGKVVVIANNGAKDADVFPATGDNIDAAGVNTAYSLTSGTNVMFISQDATDWDTISGGSGNTTTESLFEHSHTISANYSITSGNNALTAGPITINTGISVTIPTGSTWVIA